MHENTDKNVYEEFNFDKGDNVGILFGLYGPRKQLEKVRLLGDLNRHLCTKCNQVHSGP